MLAYSLGSWQKERRLLEAVLLLVVVQWVGGIPFLLGGSTGMGYSGILRCIKFQPWRIRSSNPLPHQDDGD